MDPAKRESEVARFLEDIQGTGPSVLIGGYAVAAYGPPRFSVDIDLALPQSLFEPIRRWLAAEGFSPKLTMGSERSADSLRKLRAQRGDVSSDLYFGGVRARESGAEVPFRWLGDRPRSMRLRLRTLTTRGDVRVARPEALWVLKLLAGRPQDLSDLFAIRQQAIETYEVSSMLASLNSPKLRLTVDRVSKLLESPALYRDSLSRWELGSPELPQHRAEWTTFRQRVLALLNSCR
ncbi:MAG: nucleotidyl transferase AbiEii/AbiGii toxin family protein [Thermoplasmata archaeon]